MGAGLGFKTFVTGDVLTATDTNGYLMQGVWVFASAAARDAAVTSPQEGNMCYLKDTDAVQYYSGSAWTAVGGSSGFVGCALWKSTTQSVNSSTSTNVSFDSELLDTSGFHDNATNNERITVPAGKAGKYQLILTIAFAGNATGYRETSILKNGTPIVYGNTPPTANAPTFTVTTIVSASVADYFTSQVYQTSGGALNVVGTNAAYTQFQAIYLGA